MKPAPFAYLAPGSVQEVLDALHKFGSDARLLAGGQSLIPALNFRSMQPKVVIDLNRLPELSYIQQDRNGMVQIGAMTRQHTLETNSTIEEALPLMYEAVPFVAHLAIRTRGTIGGSLAYADPAGEQPTITTALDAKFKAMSTQGERWVPAEKFFIHTHQTDLKNDEMLVEISVPAIQPGTGWAFEEVARRAGDRVLMGVAAVVKLDDKNICREARLVYQNGAAIPFLAQQASQLLLGHSASEELYAEVAEIASKKEIDPATDIHATASFRRNLARELTLRVLRAAFKRASRAKG